VFLSIQKFEHLLEIYDIAETLENHVLQAAYSIPQVHDSGVLCAADDY